MNGKKDRVEAAAVKKKRGFVTQATSSISTGPSSIAASCKDGVQAAQPLAGAGCSMMRLYSSSATAM